MVKKKIGLVIFLCSIVIPIGVILLEQRNMTKHIRINEICNNNFSNYCDEKGNYFNWIELYNASDEICSLKGYQLSSGRFTHGYEFDNIKILPREFLVVFLAENMESSFSNIYADVFVNDNTKALYLLNPNNQIVDTVEIRQTDVNLSYARSVDGEGIWQMQEASPMFSNENNLAIKKETSEKKKVMTPRFSKESGFYDEAFKLSIEHSDDVKVFYTDDGSVPDKYSKQYIGSIVINDASNRKNFYSDKKDTTAQFYYEPDAIALPKHNVDKANIIRAVAMDREGNYSDVVSASYFVGYDCKSEYDGFQVISLISEPDYFFGYETGIYVTGKIYDGIQTTDDWLWKNANYRKKGKSAERQVYLELYDEQRKLMLSKECGIRIRGKATRAYLQKGFNLYARPEYDNTSSFNYDFWNDGINEWSEFSLSMGGNDLVTKTTDYLLFKVSEQMNFSVSRQIPCVVFLNGEYWGLYYIAEKLGAEYICNKYKVKKENVVMIRNWELEEGNDADIKKLHEDMELIGTMDLTNDNNYQKACELVDMDSLLDYYAFQVYVGRHGDWLGRPDEGGNWGVWKTNKIAHEKYYDGKWRWLLFDMSPSIPSPDFDSFTFIDTKSYYNVFPNLMTNNEFKSQFWKKIERLAHDTFEPSVMNELIDRISTQMEPQVLLTHERYYCDIYTKGEYDVDMKNKKNFFDYRYINLLQLRDNKG